MENSANNAPPENKTPETFINVFSIVTETVQNYGWVLLVGVVIVYYVVHKYLNPSLENIAKRREERMEHKKYDTDAVQQRLEAMEKSRQKLQDNYNHQTAKYIEEQKQKEEEKRKAKIEDWDRHQEGKGYRSKFKPEESSSSGANSSKQVDKSDKKKLKPNDYNPLMGGTSFGYRPARRGASGGG